MPRRVDLFPTLDEAGFRLAEVIIGRAAEVLPDVRIEPVTSVAPTAIPQSLIRAQATILDLTPAPDGAHRYTTMAYPWRQPGVLAVSRTYLPVNVAPARRGGAGLYPGGLSDHEIADWVVGQLAEMLAVRRGFFRKVASAMGVGDLARTEDPWANADIFVSYRTADLQAARQLRDELQAGVHHGGRPQKVVLFDPGQLAHPTAVLPPLLRWNVLAVISDIVNTCREMWVVDNPDFLSSWWTQGELMCRLYFKESVSLTVYQPGQGVTTSSPVYSAHLTEDDHRRMARLFVNSHPDIMSPEAVEAMGLLRPTRWPMANDDVFSGEFQTVPLLQCPRCSLSPSAPKELDVAGFLHNANPRLFSVPPDDLKSCAENRTWLACPSGCGQQFTVDSLPPAYFWFGLPVGPSKSFLEAMPLYEARPVPDPRPARAG